jgi:hypothetical protein
MSLTPVKGGWVYNAPQWPKMELICAEGKIYGARYYTVEPKWFTMPWHDMEDWCEHTFGPVSHVWGVGANLPTDTKRWYANSGMFWFRNEADRNWFMLKWQ